MVGNVLLCFVWGLFISLFFHGLSVQHSPINRCMIGLSYEAFFCVKFQRHTELLHIGVIGLHLSWILGCRMFPKYACSKLMFYQLYSTGKLQIMPETNRFASVFFLFWLVLCCFVWRLFIIWKMPQLPWSIRVRKNWVHSPLNCSKIGHSYEAFIYPFGLDWLSVRSAGLRFECVFHCVNPGCPTLCFWAPLAHFYYLSGSFSFLIILRTLLLRISQLRNFLNIFPPWLTYGTVTFD